MGLTSLTAHLDQDDHDMLHCPMVGKWRGDVENRRVSQLVFKISLGISWKMEHLLQQSKRSIFHNIFKHVIFQRRQKALFGSKRLIHEKACLIPILKNPLYKIIPI